MHSLCSFFTLLSYYCIFNLVFFCSNASMYTVKCFLELLITICSCFYPLPGIPRYNCLFLNMWLEN